MLKYVRRLLRDVRIRYHMRQLCVRSYDIAADGNVNVLGDVDIPPHYKRIPVQFGVVLGSFHCDGTQITSLAGAPYVVMCRFCCNDTHIQSLEHGPTWVGENFFCVNTLITSLDGAPKFIGGALLICHNERLTSLLPAVKIKGMQTVVHEADHIINAHYKSDGTGDIIALQDDLIEAGWAHIARLK